MYNIIIHKITNNKGDMHDKKRTRTIIHEMGCRIRTTRIRWQYSGVLRNGDDSMKQGYKARGIYVSTGRYTYVSHHWRNTLRAAEKDVDYARRSKEFDMTTMEIIKKVKVGGWE